jgi:hypothetical protein
MEGGELLEWGWRAVVVGSQLGEDRGMGPTGTNGCELLLGVLDCIRHLGIGFAQDVGDHSCSSP